MDAGGFGLRGIRAGKARRSNAEARASIFVPESPLRMYYGGMNDSIRMGMVLSLVVCNAWSQWIPTQGPSTESVEALVSAQGVFYAGVSGSPVYRSRDDGKTWQPIARGLQYYPDRNMGKGILLDATGSTVYAATIVGRFFKTTNASEEWTDLDISREGGSAIQAISAVGNALIIGTNGEGALRSVDGAAWSKMAPDGSIGSFTVLGSCYIAGSRDGGFFISQDGGRTWNLDSKTTVDGQHGTFPVTTLDAGGLGILGGSFNGRLYYSADTGRTWFKNQIDIGELDDIITVGVDDSALFAGTRAHGLFRSIDRGITWVPVPDISRKSIFSFAKSGSTLLAGTELEGIYRSTDHGAHWTLSNPGIHTAQITEMTAVGGMLIAGAGKNQTFRTRDGGDSWENRSDSLVPVHNLATMGADVFAASINGLFRSRDSGTSWNRILLPGADYDFPSLSMVVRVDSTLYAGGHDISRSRDSGKTWSLIAGSYGFDRDQYSGFNGIARIRATLFSVLKNGLFSSEDEGMSWKPVRLNPSVASVMEMGGRLFISGSDGANRSDDLGKTWKKIGSEMGAGAPTGFYPAEDFLFAISSIGRVYRSSDLGDTWIPMYAGLEGVRVNALQSNGSYLFAGTEDNGVWRRPWAEVSSSMRPAKGRISLSPGFEGRKSGILRSGEPIRFSLPKSAHVRLSMVDISGREVRIFLDGNLGPGPHSLAFTGASVSRGLYFLRLQAGDSTTLLRVLSAE
jgi:photosystem II stability/assembly factor-like uncharacterized protein